MLDLSPLCGFTVRGTDKYGSGAFQAPRSRPTPGAGLLCQCILDGGAAPRHPLVDHYTHHGIDLCAAPGDPFPVPCAGIITMYGWAYDPIQWPLLRSIHIQPSAMPSWDVKVLYALLTERALGETVVPGGFLGVAGDVASKYPDITKHVHVEVRDENGIPLDPTPLIYGHSGVVA